MAFSAKTRRYLIAFLILGWSITLIYSALRTNPSKFPLKTKQLYRNNRLLMGTFWEVVSSDQRASAIVFSEASRIEQLLSKYIPGSEISRLNRLGKLKVSPDTFYILQKSKQFWRLSNGAFDVTVGPLLELWGFADKRYSLPKKNAVRKNLALVGCDKIIFNIDDNVIKFKLSGMKIDLGAIAKGYAIDRAVKKLKESGVRSCLINAGGQVYCLGDKFGRPWRVAVRGYTGKGHAGYLELKDQSVATSGGYEQYFIKDNKRYCHILNPKTGFPVDLNVERVTVVAPSALTADALSTSIFVLGKSEGMELANKFVGVKVAVIEDKDVQNYL